MKPKVWKVLLSGVAIALPGPALAWGREGHRVVAEIAELELSPAARQQVHKLLALEGTAHMGDVASWADQVKHQRTNRPAHTLRLPLGNSPIKLDSCPNEFCAVNGIEHYTRILRDSKASPTARLEALKYVIHLTGDIHAPLHAAEVTGGKIKVTFNGEQTTLHKVWDRYIIALEGGPPATLARRLISEERGVKTSGAPLDWAIESRNIARDVIFRCFPTRTKETIPVGREYARANWPIVRARLAAAGFRLAGILNKSF